MAGDFFETFDAPVKHIDKCPSLLPNNSGSPPFKYPVEFRRLVYTTNAIESLHSQMRKNIAGGKLFPNDIAVLKSCSSISETFQTADLAGQGWDLVIISSSPCSRSTETRGH